VNRTPEVPIDKTANKCFSTHRPRIDDWVDAKKTEKRGEV